MTSILDFSMTLETRRRLRREAESLIKMTLNTAPDQLVAAVALLSDEVIDAIAIAICTTVQSTLDP